MAAAAAAAPFSVCLLPRAASPAAALIAALLGGSVPVGIAFGARLNYVSWKSNGIIIVITLVSN